LQETIYRFVREGIADGEFRDGDAEAMALSIIAVLTLATLLELCNSEMSLGRKGIGRLLDVLFNGMKDRDFGKGKRKRT